MEFYTRKSARDYLETKGLTLNYVGVFSDQDREYWHYGDETDVFLDHSATITRLGSVFYVSDFTEKRRSA